MSVSLLALLASCNESKKDQQINVHVSPSRDMGPSKTATEDEDKEESDSSKQERLNRILNHNVQLDKPEREIVEKVTNIDLKTSCALVNNLEDKKRREKLLSQYDNHQIYSTGSKKYTVHSLMENFFESLPFRAKDNAKAFHDKLAKNAIKKILTNQQSYMGIVEIPNLKDQMSELNNCLEEESAFKNLQQLAKVNNKLDKKAQDLYKVFIVNNLINSFKANILYTFSDEIKEKKQIHEDNVRKKRNRVYYRGNRDFHKKIKDEKLDKINSQLNESKTPIGVMLQQSPLLFTYENDMSADDWVNIQIEKSDIQEFMLKDFDPKLMKQMTKAFRKSNNIMSFQKVLLAKENQKYLDRYAEELINNEQLQGMVLEKLEEFINTVNNGATKICENDKFTLHHNEDLVKYTLDQNAKLDNYANTMTRDHVGYCELLRTNPKEDLSSFTWRTGVGMTLLGIGAGAQVFLGLGNLVGIGLMGAGGAILTGETAYNSYISYEQEVRGQAIHFGGWSDYREVSNMMGQTGDFLTDIGTDAVLTVVGAGSGKILKGLEFLKFASKEDLLGTADGIVQARKFRRGGLNQALLEDGSEQAIAQYKRLIWKRHKSMWATYKASAQRYKILSKREWYRIRNRNDIPAYHIYGQSGNETYGILDIASNAKRLDSDEGADALLQIEKWMTDYKSYKTEIDTAIDKGFLASKQKSSDVLKRYKPEDFFGGQSQTVKVLDVVDGKYVKVDRTFESYYEMNKFMKEQGSLSVSTFARNSLEELTDNSDLYRIMDTQAIDYRRLEFLRDKLKSVDSPTEKQKELLDTAVSLLADSKLTPRPDALLRLQKLELRAERVDFIRSMKKKEKLLSGLKFPLSDKASAIAKETGFVGRNFKSFLIVGVSTLSTGGVTTYFKTGGSYDEISSTTDLALDDMSRSLNNGYTTDERECAEQLRNFSFGICFANLAKKELSVHRARAIVTEEDYVYANDKTAVRAIYDLAYRILKLRKKLRGAELYMLASSILNTSYETHAKRDVIELIKSVSNDNVVTAKAAHILGAETKEESIELLEKYTGDLGDDFSKALLYIIKNKSKVVDSVKSSGRLPRKLELLIQSIEDDSVNYDIIDEDFFDFTMGVLEKTAMPQD